MTYVYPTATPVVVTVTPPTPASVEVTNVYAGALNQPEIAYHFIQQTPSNSWIITHNLGWIPNVTVQDSAGNIVEGEIAYTNTKQLTITFSAAFSGNAYLS